MADENRTNRNRNLDQVIATSDDTMKYIDVKYWSKQNRIERIKGIVESLGRSGHAEAEYFKGRSYLPRIFLGIGKPKSMTEDEKWNHVIIKYNEKTALEILDSDFGIDGRYFDEDFRESENQQIMNCLSVSGASIQRAYASRIRWLRFILIFGAILELVMIVESSHNNDPVTRAASSFCLLGFLVFLSRT